MNLRKRMDGISGTSCSHEENAFGDPIYNEACTKHHGDAAHRIVMQWLDDPEVAAELYDKMGGNAETVKSLIRAFLETLKEL